MEKYLFIKKTNRISENGTKLLCAAMLLMVFGLTVNAQNPTKEELYPTDGYRSFRKAPEFAVTIDFEHIDFNRLNEVIFHLTNEIRVENKLRPLQYSYELERAAVMHANDMVADGFFSHINSRDVAKSTPNDRAKLCQISNPFLAENIIEGFGLQYKANETVYLRGRGMFSKTPRGELIKPHTYLSLGEVLLDGWMNSREHRKNILSKDALQLGCGTAFFTSSDFNDMPTFYAVQNFQWYHPVIVAKNE